MLALLVLSLASSPIPLAPGTWWEYRESYTERIGALDSTQDEITRFAVGGSDERPFVHQTGGADPVSGPVEFGAGWIAVTPWTGEDRLPLPIAPGRVGPPGPGGTDGWMVEALETVTVPAGTFEALRCALRTRRAASVLWIAEGIGVVRETHGTPGRRPEIERVLLRWSGARQPDNEAAE